MNTYIKNRGQGIALFYTLFLSLLFLLPQKAIAVVETVHYSMNPEDVVCTPQLKDNGTPYFSVEWKGHTYAPEGYMADAWLHEEVFFLVPRDTKNFRVSVDATPGHSVIHELKKMEIPLTPTSPRYYDSDSIRYKENIPISFNSSDGTYVEIISDGYILGDWHVVRVAVHPFVYSYADESLRIEPELDITLSYDYCDANDLKDSYITSNRTFSEINNVLASINFINKEAANYLLENQTSNIVSYSTIEKYYIIVPESLKSSVQDLAIWKSQKGYDVIIETIEDILSNPKYKLGEISTITGEVIFDEASALRAYLQQQFKNNGVFYCFLIGDWRTSMPIRKYSPDLSPEKEYNYNSQLFTPSDNYFSDLTSYICFDSIKSDPYDWVADENSKFYPDIFLGRLLCSTDQEVYNYFEKLRIYESYPGKGDDSYLTRALYFEENPNNNRSSLVGLTLESMEALDIFSEIIYARDKDEVQGYTAPSMPMKGKDIIRYMSRTGYNSWLGHGHPTGILTCGSDNFIIPINSYTRGVDGQVARRESSDDTDNGLDLIDNINYPGIAYSGACCIAPFDRFEEGDHIFDMPYNMAGAYTVSGLNGGVAIIANTRDIPIGDGQLLQLAFSKQIKLTPKFGIGHLISKSICQSNCNGIVLVPNLIGEPEFEMWLDRPNHFNTTRVDWHTSNIADPSLKGALYTVCDGNTWVYRFLSDGTPDPSLGTYESYMPLISVWKQGYLPKLTLYAREGNFTNVKKKYFAQEAIFGSADTSKQCVVGKDASVEIDVMTAIVINDGFHAEVGGKVDIICRDDITASGELVKAGGEVNLYGKTIVLESGFKVES
ncbi:MAG: hypothetical protein K2M67_02875, partial [Muribaculaceae bacterium]|nr:hypothetical protein [Muribaculaceae bacterium]